MDGRQSPSGTLDLFFQSSSAGQEGAGAKGWLTGRLAGAVPAPMFGACPAGLGDTLFQCLSRAKHADAGIARRQTALFGERLDGRPLDVNRLQRLRVLGLQCAGETAHAGADFDFHLGLWCRVAFELPGKRLDRSACRAPAAKLVDGRVSQRTVEPWHDAFVRGGLLRTLGNLCKRVLQDVFRQFAVADPSLQVLQECAVVLEQNGYRRLRGDWFDVL